MKTGLAKFAESDLIPDGKVALMHQGKAVWYGSLGDPEIRNLIFDTVVMSPKDFTDFETHVRLKTN